MIEPVREVGVRQALWSGAQRGPASAPGIVTGDEEIGNQVEFRVRKGNSRDCEAPASAIVNAELRVKNDRSMWFVDVENPAAGFTDEQLQEMADLFDDHIYATETNYLGVPNDKDGNSRIGIMVTRQINIDNGEDPAVIGFVNPCDLFTRGEQNVHTSNEGEFFYAVAPDPEGAHGQVMLTDGLFDFLPVVIAHEFAHIIQFSHRFTQDGELMALFMAEGQATLAEEVVGHSILVNGPGQNLNVEVALDFEGTQSYAWFWNPWIDLIYYFGWGRAETSLSESREPLRGVRGQMKGRTIRAGAAPCGTGSRGPSFAGQRISSVRTSGVSRCYIRRSSATTSPDSTTSGRSWAPMVPWRLS